MQTGCSRIARDVRWLLLVFWLVHVGIEDNIRYMKQFDRDIRLKRMGKKSVAVVIFRNERCAYFIQDQFNTQDEFAPIAQHRAN